MSVSYKKLWKILIDRELKKKDLIKLSGISTASMAKLGRNKNITTEVLAKICNALKVDIGDIMEVLPEESGDNYEKQKASNKK
ncbi:helix-turn-helix domain-containing protein [Clostridium intestinale]|uniref:XRE family transcriptional regulator n=2 Tax=Clostridium intestinale TaxID=36845 RepID=U2N577_9CLOT|nr:helix-turn-helix transcriptional regulator [Clostridium intestinale]ERK30662.1 XRE family transcriptional regulator [Clostridium intestinale URNW]QLY81366.1 helix-turn-helix transcriptional regulator [Clostridium intestinale]